MKWIAFFLICFFACTQDRQALADLIIQERITDRVNEFQTLEYKKCRERILEEAIRKVDSLLREDPLLVRIDTLNRPPKPQKPAEPFLRIPKDTVPLEPFIN